MDNKDTPMDYKQKECSRALRCLYIAVDESVAADVDNKVSAYVHELKTRIKFLEELLNEDLHEENVSLKLELQKQKKLKDELKSEFIFCAKVLKSAIDSDALWVNEFDWERIESLIKKSSEI